MSQPHGLLCGSHGQCLEHLEKGWPSVVTAGTSLVPCPGPLGPCNWPDSCVQVLSALLLKGDVYDFLQGTAPHQIHRECICLFSIHTMTYCTAGKMDELICDSPCMSHGSLCPLGGLSPTTDRCGSVRAGPPVLG